MHGFREELNPSYKLPLRTLLNSLPAALMRADRFADRLDRDRHVERIGVDQRVRVAHDGDVALPEQEIAAAQIGEIARGESATPSAAS